jgi:hypothetical protein
LADPVAALSEALELYTYAQNTQTLLLYPRYQKVLQATQVYEPVRWRTLSKNITTALAVSDINETVSGWSIRISSKDAKTIEDLVWNSSDQYHGRHFTRIVSGKSFRQVHYLCFYPNPSKPKFIGAIGIKKSAATGDLLISPTILLGELSLTAHCDLHRQLTRLFPDITFLSANDDHLTGNERLYARWLVETNLLFLGRILFQKWEQEIAAQIELFSQSDARQTRHHFPPIQLDVRQTAANFATLQQALDPELPSVSEELERWFWNDLWSDTETMGHLIAASLSEATPVWPYTMKPEQEGQHFFQKKAVTAMVDEQIENTVWRKGQQWEKEAYQLYMSGLSAEEHTYTKDSHQYPLRRLFSDIFAALDNGNVPYAQYYRYYVVASILRMQEMGTLDIEPAYQAQEESCYLNVHMGEPATTILPARYEKYILALQAIQKNCQENQLDLEREIQRFVKNLSGANTRQDNTDLAEKLFDFVKKLTASGQSLDEWRFSMATCSTQLGKQFKNARNSMIDMISTQFWYLYQYQQIS